MFNGFVNPVAVCASLFVTWAGAATAVHASDYMHTCRVEGGIYVIDDGALYETEKYKGGSPGEPIPYRVISEATHSEEKGYCISWKQKPEHRYEFRVRRYKQRIAFDRDGQSWELDAKCALYGDGMPANLEPPR